MFGGGFPGMFMQGDEDMPQMGRRERKPVDNSTFYKTLGISKTAKPIEIKKAYRKKAKTSHPDRGGDEEEFKKIQKAYETLSNPEKRKIYDEYGEEGLENGGRGAGGADDLFSAFFGGGGRGGRRSEDRGPQKGKPVKHPLKASLNQLYNGRTVNIKITRKRIKYPKGMNRENAVVVCASCRGQGRVMKIRQLGPGMIQQMQMPCQECNGLGKKMAPGCKAYDDQKVLEVRIDRGMAHGDKIVEHEEADEEPGQIPGDVVFIVQEKPHKVFKRQHADLLVMKDISLYEALCGVEFELKHLDNRILHVRTPKGRIVRDGSFFKIPGEGMPLRSNPFEKGDLFIRFSVEMPPNGSLSQQQRQVLKSVLGKHTKHQPLKKIESKEMEDMDEDDIPEDVELVEVKEEEFGKRRAQGGGNAYDEDEEGPRGGQQVQCAHQ